MRHLWIVFVTIALFIEIFAQPISKREATTCYGFTCPSGTVGCKKLTKTTDDGKNLKTTVECQDSQGNVMDTHSKTELNPFGSGTQFTSYSFTGNYHYSNKHQSGTRNPGINLNNNYNYNNEVEEI